MAQHERVNAALPVIGDRAAAIVGAVHLHVRRREGERLRRTLPLLLPLFSPLLRLLRPLLRTLLPFLRVFLPFLRPFLAELLVELLAPLGPLLALIAPLLAHFGELALL